MLSLLQNKEILNLDQKMFYFGISKPEYKKLFSYMKSTTSNFSKCQVSHKAKNLKFGTKNTSFGQFWVAILKGYCHIWNQHPRVCQNAEFNKFGTENVLFAYFSAGTWKNYYHIGSLHARIFRNAKTCPNQRNFKFGAKNTLLGYFWL